MKRLNNCQVENCIPTPSSCVEWNGGDIEFLGINNGDSLNTLMWEVVSKIQDIAGDDLSGFDIDSLVDICNNKAPNEITLLSILNIVKDNQICLKDFIDTLSSQIVELSKESKVNINLKCYEELDNLGNSLSITRDQLDQLVIDKLCAHEGRLDTVEGKITSLQEQINEINNDSTVLEVNIATCVDSGIKPTSVQLVAVAKAHCDLETAIGSPSDVSAALANIPADWNSRYSTLVGWNANATSLADWFANALLVLANNDARTSYMEDNCCAPDCDDIKIGFSVVLNEDNTGLILKFTSGAGTKIPAAFNDIGSSGVIKDAKGNTESFTVAIVNNHEEEVITTGLTLSGELTVSLTTKFGSGSMICSKEYNKVINLGSACGVCEITATGTGTAVIVYEDETSGYVQAATTTTSSTTTTTTAS